MKEIGGYFELELTDRGGFPHDDGILVNSGSNALEYILRFLGDVKCVWMPYFTCSIVLKPFKNTGIPYKFYQIKAYRLVLEYMFNERNIHRVMAIVLENNVASLKMHQKIDYQIEGLMRDSVYKDGKWQNQYILGLLRNEYKK